MPTALSTDFTRESSMAVMLDLVSRTVKNKPASPDWAVRCWQANEVHAAKLGPTLRRVECGPAIRGHELLDVYRNAFRDATQGVINWPADVTAEDCESQKVAKAKGRKLTRHLADYLDGVWQSAKERLSAETYLSLPVPQQSAYSIGQELNRIHGTYSRDNVSRIIDRVQTAVRAHNGLQIVLSANPLDKLLTSDFATYSSCHSWTFGLYGAAYSAGNFAYTLSPNVLVAYVYRDNTTRDGVTLPQKFWRMMVYLSPHATDTAVLSRIYGTGISELNYNMVRRMVAEFLAGADNPPWRRLEFSSGYIRSRYAYCDGASCAITLRPAGEDVRILDSRLPDGGYLDVTDCYCPTCGIRREDNYTGRIQCPRCANHRDRRCNACGCSLTAETSWTGPDSHDYCETCYVQVSGTCGHCGSRFMSSSLETIHVSGEDKRVCRYCRREAFTRCIDCRGWFYRLSMRSSGRCYDCQGKVDDAKAAETAALLALPLVGKLEEGKRYRTRDGRTRGPMRYRGPSFKLYPFTDGHFTYRATGQYDADRDAPQSARMMDLVACLDPDTSAAQLVLTPGEWLTRSGLRVTIAPCAKEDTPPHVWQDGYRFRGVGGRDLAGCFWSADGKFWPQRVSESPNDIIEPAPVTV